MAGQYLGDMMRTVLSLDDAVLVAFVDGDEVDVPRSEVVREAGEGFTMLFGTWPAGTVLDMVGLAIAPDGPIVVRFALGERVTVGEVSVGVRVEGDGSVLSFDLS